MISIQSIYKKITFNCGMDRKNIKNILELYGQGNFLQNIFKIFGVTIGHARRANIRHEHEDPQNLRLRISEKIWNVPYGTTSKSAQVELQPHKSLTYRLATHILVGSQLSNLLSCKSLLLLLKLATCCLTIRSLLARTLVILKIMLLT